MSFIFMMTNAIFDSIFLHFCIEKKMKKNKLILNLWFLTNSFYLIFLIFVKKV